MDNPNGDPIPQMRSLKDIYDNPAEQLFGLTRDEVIGGLRERVVSWGDPLPADNYQKADSSGIPIDQLTLGDYILMGLLASDSEKRQNSWNVDLGVGGIGERGIYYYKLVKEGLSVRGLFELYIPRNRNGGDNKGEALKVVGDSNFMSVQLSPGKRTYGEDPEKYYLRATAKTPRTDDVQSQVRDLNDLFVELGLSKKEEMGSEED